MSRESQVPDRELHSAEDAATSQQIAGTHPVVEWVSGKVSCIWRRQELQAATDEWMSGCAGIVNPNIVLLGVSGDI